MVCAKDGDDVCIWVFDEIQILKHRVSGSSVRCLRACACARLSESWDDEVILKQTAELPSISQVFQERLAPVLNDNVDGEDLGIYKVAEDKIDDSVLPAERHSRLGALSREGQQTIASATCKDECYYFTSHGKWSLGRDHLMAEMCAIRSGVCVRTPGRWPDSVGSKQ
jgi:hypothetical protein